jgi:hypothetical protein
VRHVLVATTQDKSANTRVTNEKLVRVRQQDLSPSPNLSSRTRTTPEYVVVELVYLSSQRTRHKLGDPRPTTRRLI